MQLFKVQTIPQFKIHQFLVKEGLQPEAVAAVKFPDRDSVKIRDCQGSEMTVKRADTGVYEFRYNIRGVASAETRYDPDEYNVTSAEAAP